MVPVQAMDVTIALLMLFAPRIATLDSQMDLVLPTGLIFAAKTYPVRLIALPGLGMGAVPVTVRTIAPKF